MTSGQTEKEETNIKGRVYGGVRSLPAAVAVRYIMPYVQAGGHA